MVLKNASNQRGANSVTVAAWHRKSQPLLNTGRFESCISQKLFGG